MGYWDTTFFAQISLIMTSETAVDGFLFYKDLEDALVLLSNSDNGFEVTTLNVTPDLSEHSLTRVAQIRVDVAQPEDAKNVARYLQEYAGWTDLLSSFKIQIENATFSVQ